MFPFPFSFLGAGEAPPPPELELIDNNFAMEFDAGSSQYINSSILALNNATALTFSGWLKKTSGNCHLDC